MYHGHVPCSNPACRSLETQAGFDEYTCLRCGTLTRLHKEDGNPNEPHIGAPVPPEVQYAPKNM